jgi:hypothetical protein
MAFHRFGLCTSPLVCLWMAHNAIQFAHQLPLLCRFSASSRWGAAVSFSLRGLTHRRLRGLGALGDRNRAGTDQQMSSGSYSRGRAGRLPGRTRLGGELSHQSAAAYPTIFRIRNSAPMLAYVPSSFHDDDDELPARTFVLTSANDLLSWLISTTLASASLFLSPNFHISNTLRATSSYPGITRSLLLTFISRYQPGIPHFPQSAFV